MKRKFAIYLTIFCFAAQIQAQETRNISLKEAVQLGLKNSHKLKADSGMIQAAIAQLSSAKDNSLPAAKASYGFSKAFFISNKFKLPIPGQEHPIELPSNNNLHLGTLSLSEVIFAGNKIKLAKESSQILIDMQKYNYQDQQDEVVLQLIKAYFQLYKSDKMQGVVQQTLNDIQHNIKRIRAFKSQGMATKNDVLRWELQMANARLDSIDISNGRKMVNYTLDLLLGLPENTIIHPTDSAFGNTSSITFETALKNAMGSRASLKAVNEKVSLSKLKIKSAKGNELPTLAAVGSLYYINPNAKFFPEQYTYLAPYMIGLNLSWNIASLYTTKHKVDIAKANSLTATSQKAALTDAVKMQVKSAYLNYKKAQEKVDVLNVAVSQATENKDIFAAKYQNHLASTTERLDAETQLFKTQIQLELAKVGAQLAYYKMLQTTGKLNVQNIK